MQSELAAVNKQSKRLAEKLDGWSRAAISRRLSEAIVSGKDMTSAVVGLFEELETAPGQVVPIGKLEDVNRKEVSIEGRIEVLWESNSPAIAQVGLIEDESGQTKVTIWEKSNASWVEEGEQVRIHGAARNWYNGRVSVAVTGWSTIMFPSAVGGGSSQSSQSSFCYVPDRPRPHLPTLRSVLAHFVRCARSHNLVTQVKKSRRRVPKDRPERVFLRRKRCGADFRQRPDLRWNQRSEYIPVNSVEPNSKHQEQRAVTNERTRSRSVRKSY